MKLDSVMCKTRVYLSKFDTIESKMFRGLPEVTGPDLKTAILDLPKIAAAQFVKIFKQHLIYVSYNFKYYTVMQNIHSSLSRTFSSLL